MKNLYIISLILVGSFLISSCGTTNSAYVDDIYYNPKKEARKKAKEQERFAENQKQAFIDNSTQDSTSEEFFLSDYDDYEYADRLNKFHDDEYEGDYYDEGDANWNVGVNMGFSPYGSSWGMSFGYGNYGYNPYYSPYYSPYYPYYDPWYSWYSPWSYWGYPYYGYYPPYYSCCCYGDYYPGYPENDRDYYYGPRSSVASSSPIENTGGSTSTRKNTVINSTGSAVAITNQPDMLGGNTTRVVEGGASAAVSRQSALNERSGVSISEEDVNKTYQNTLSSGKTTNPTKVRTTSIVESNGKTRRTGGSSGIVKETTRVPSYTRTRTEASKNIQLSGSNSRSGYTPSYSQNRLNSTRTTYNPGSGYTSNRISNINKNNISYTNSRKTNSSSQNTRFSSNRSTYQRNTSTSGTSRSSYSTPKRSSSSSRSHYTAPKTSSSSSRSSYSGSSSRSSSSRSSSYSAPRSSSSSSSRSSSGSSGSRSSSSSKSRR